MKKYRLRDGVNFLIFNIIVFVRNGGKDGSVRLLDMSYQLLLEDRRDDSILRSEEEKETERQSAMNLDEEIKTNEGILWSLQGRGLDLRVDGEGGKKL